jgi:hypothetical protein
MTSGNHKNYPEATLTDSGYSVAARANPTNGARIFDMILSEVFRDGVAVLPT